MYCNSHKEDLRFMGKFDTCIIFAKKAQNISQLSKFLLPYMYSWVQTLPKLLLGGLTISHAKDPLQCINTFLWILHQTKCDHFLSVYNPQAALLWMLASSFQSFLCFRLKKLKSLSGSIGIKVSPPNIQPGFPKPYAWLCILRVTALKFHHLRTRTYKAFHIVFIIISSSLHTISPYLLVKDMVHSAFSN